MMNLILIAVGGALGALSRYGAGQLAQKFAVTPFFISTLLVNILGCFLIGVVAHVHMVGFPSTEPLRYSAMIGFMGSFTTFSMFSHETFNLIENGQYGVAGGYALASVVLCVLSTYAGFSIARGIV